MLNFQSVLAFHNLGDWTHPSESFPQKAGLWRLDICEAVAGRFTAGTAVPSSCPRLPRGGRLTLGLGALGQRTHKLFPLLQHVFCRGLG